MGSFDMTSLQTGMAGAQEFVKDGLNVTEDFVNLAMNKHAGWADKFSKEALDAVDALSKLKPDKPFTLEDIPSVPTVALPAIDLDLPALEETTYPDIDVGDKPTKPSQITPPSLDDLELDIADFESQIKSFNIPDAPELGAMPTEPTKPELDKIGTVEDPVYTMPDEPTLKDVEFPEFAKLTLPEFEGYTLPLETSIQAPTEKFTYVEPEYKTERLDEILPVLKKMWSGEYGGLPVLIRNAMVIRAIDNEDKVLSRDTDSILQEYATRGFTAPPGMMIARIDTLRRDSAVRKSEAVRDLNINFAEIDIANIRFGLEQYTAAENLYFNIHSNIAQRAFEVARTSVEMALQVFNAKVMYFNALLQRADAAVKIYEIKVRGALARLEIDRLELEKAIAMGTINDQKIRIYTAQLEAVRTIVDVFKTKAELLDISAGLNRSKVEAYKAEVTAFGELINARESIVRLYTAQISGEAAKGGIMDAEARAYSAMITGRVAKSDIGFKKYDAVLKYNENMLAYYAEEMRALQIMASTEIANMEIKVKGRQMDIDKYKAEIGAKETKAQVTATLYESDSRMQVARFQALARRAELLMEQSTKNLNMMQESYKAIGQIMSTLSASAMAGVHAGSNLTGTVTASAGAQYNMTYKGT